MTRLTAFQKQGLSVLISWLVYAIFFGWSIGLMIVTTIVWHEYCHLLAGKYLGLKTKGMYLAPFMGGVSFIDGEYKSTLDRVFVVIGGPLGGGLLACVVAILFAFTGERHLAIIAWFMLTLNIFNLLPLSILDGGQLLMCVISNYSRKTKLIVQLASMLVGAFVIASFNLLLGVVVSLIGFWTWKREMNNYKAFYRGDLHLCDQSYLEPTPPLTAKQAWLTLFCWAALLGLLIFALVFIAANSHPEHLSW